MDGARRNSGPVDRGWLGFVLSHLRRKDKDAPKMGHPRSCSFRMGQTRSLVEEHGAVEGVALDGFEAGVADDVGNATAGPSAPSAARTALRMTEASLVSCFPRSQNRDLGHPFSCLGQSAELNSVVSHPFDKRKSCPEGAQRGRGGIPVRLTEVGWGLCYPTLATKTKASRGWGTQGRACIARESAQNLVEEHGAVEGVALDGFEAGVADDSS
jgi:hypothetical protein